MPWFINPLEYSCDDCGNRYYNRPAAQVGLGQHSSPVKTFGANNAVTRCTDCAGNHNMHFNSGIEKLGVSLSTTITYKIHNGGNFSFHGGPVTMAAMAGGTMGAMGAAGALGLMAHPAYPGGMIRAPGAFSGPNLGHAALAGWPAAGAGMNMHHVHVGQGINNRVLFGWSANAYPNHPANVQGIKLYIGS